MKVDMKEHANIRAQVHAGLAALRVQGKQLSLDNNDLWIKQCADWAVTNSTDRDRALGRLGNIIISTILYIDAMGLDVIECLELAMEARKQ